MKTYTMQIAQGNIEKETEKAILLDVGTGPVWLPKSQITIKGIENPIEVGTLEMPYWLAKKKGLNFRPVTCWL